MQRHRLKGWLQAILGLALLAWIFRAVAWNQLFESLARANPLWFLGALSAAAAQMVISAWRWQVVLHIQLGERLPLTELTRYYFMSGFFNNLLPANLGGDIMRAGALFNQGRDKMAVASSVIVERVLSLIELCLLAAWAVVFGGLPVTLSLSPGLVGAGAAAALGGMIVLVWLWKRPPARLRFLVARAEALMVSYRQQKRGLALVLLITMAYHLVTMLITYCTLRAVGIDLSLQANLAIYAVAALALTLPLTIQGVGVREGVYVGLLALFGVGKEATLAALALNYLVLILYSLNGALLFWLSLREARSQVG